MKTLNKLMEKSSNNIIKFPKLTFDNTSTSRIVTQLNTEKTCNRNCIKQIKKNFKNSEITQAFLYDIISDICPTLEKKNKNFSLNKNLSIDKKVREVVNTISEYGNKKNS